MTYNFDTNGNIELLISRRNYLHGRVFCGPTSKQTTFDKMVEKKEMKIFVGTWNMNCQQPLLNVSHFILPKDIRDRADIIVIGTQETYIRDLANWVITIQDIIGPSHILKSKNRLGSLYMVIFLRRELFWFSSNLNMNKINLTKLNCCKTKGAISFGLIIFGTRFLFVSTHLAAHQSQLKNRKKQLKKIIKWSEMLNISSQRNINEDNSSSFDYIFLFGDLNFRMEKTRKDVMNWISKTHFPEEKTAILKYDQLQRLLKTEEILKDYQEAPITFPPTYKYDYGSQVLDSSIKHRTPSYTDRIIYKCKSNTAGFKSKKNLLWTAKVKCLRYDSIRSICSSDHKPVYGLFSVTLRYSPTS